MQLKLGTHPTLTQPNEYGIRGFAGDVSEWGLRFQMDSSKEKGGPQYMILPSAICRQPWEAFDKSVSGTL